MEVTESVEASVNKDLSNQKTIEIQSEKLGSMAVYKLTRVPR